MCTYGRTMNFEVGRFTIDNNVGGRESVESDCSVQVLYCIVQYTRHERISTFTFTSIVYKSKSINPFMPSVLYYAVQYLHTTITYYCQWCRGKLGPCPGCQSLGARSVGHTRARIRLHLVELVDHERVVILTGPGCDLIVSSVLLFVILTFISYHPLCLVLTVLSSLVLSCLLCVCVFVLNVCLSILLSLPPYPWSRLLSKSHVPLRIPFLLHL